MQAEQLIDLLAHGGAQTGAAFCLEIVHAFLICRISLHEVQSGGTGCGKWKQHATERIVLQEELLMKALVLGGAGYIGSHTVFALIEQGFDVAVADNLQTGHRAAVHPEARFHMGDVRDRVFMDDVLQREAPDAVIHFAANSLVGESMREPMKYYDNNVGGACTLLASMAEQGVRKIVFSSTAAVYGEPERIPIRENDKTIPTNPYGETKLAMERMFHWADVAYGVKSVSLRYFNACGAHESGCIGEAHATETHLIPIVLQVPNGQRASVNVFGNDYETRDGTCVRDYIHVTDLAQAHILAMCYLAADGESDVFNLGTGVGFTVREIIHAAERVTGHAIPAVDAPRRAGDPAQLVASGDRAREVLGWQPQFTEVEEIIASAWRWHSTHPDGFENR